MYIISTDGDRTIYGPYDSDMSVVVYPTIHLDNVVEVWHIPTANLIGSFNLEGFSIEADIPEDSTLWNEFRRGGLVGLDNGL